MGKRPLNTKNRRYKRRRKKKPGKIGIEILIIVIVVLYELFSFHAIWNALQIHPGVNEKEPSERLTSVWLDDVSFHQAIKKNGLLGIRIWLSNPNKVTEGVVAVRIGEEDTGRVLYSQDILATDIPDSILTDYIDIVPSDMTFDDDTVYFIELDALSCREKTIKTYVGLSDDDYFVSHEGDSRDLSNKKLCITYITKTIPIEFVIWVFVTVFIILVAAYSLRRGKIKNTSTKRIELPTSLESKYIVPVLVFVLAFVTGVLNFNKMSGKTVEYKDEMLEDGYAMGEHSSYSQHFTVEDTDFKEIHVCLNAFFDNTPVFVISIQKGQDEVIDTTQSNEIDYIDGAYYSWDVSNLELEEGEEYDLYVFTGYIEEDEEPPVIKRIEYVYGK